MKELEGICDEVFSTMTESAQKAWIKKYGIETIQELVPIFYSAYLNDPIDRLGRPRSLVLFINNCLRNESQYKKSDKGLDYDEILK